MTQTSEAELLAEIAQRSGQTRTKTTLIELMVDAVENVFETMCGIRFANRPQPFLGCSTKRLAISGVVGISGNLDALLIVNIDRQLAISASEALLGETFDTVSSDVIESVAELTNMIGGATKDQCGIEGCILGLPTVIHGDNHQVNLPHKTMLTTANFVSELGRLNIELGTPPTANLKSTS